MSYLELDHVGKRYGQTPVVRDLHLSVEAGEFVVLVGASGCGKSTTLRMIAGLESPDTGRIRIDGRDVTQMAPAQRDIAMVFQNYALYPHMNVAQNMSFALELAGVRAADIAQRVGNAARVLDIEALLQRKPRELSGGQRQRVAMGRAIVREPKIFLFDEPLSNLDAKLRAQMRLEIGLLHQRLAKTMVYVTHDQVEAMTLADRIVVMDKGQVQQTGSPDDVFNRPVNQYVAGFIGSPSMNFLPVSLAQQPQGLAFVGAGFALPVPARMAACATALPDGSAVLGLRPQALRPVSAETVLAPSALRLSAQVVLSEYLGTETLLTCTLAGETPAKVVVVAPGKHSARTGSPIALTADSADVFAFAAGGHGATLIDAHRSAGTFSSQPPAPFQPPLEVS
ncbi:MAG TPA: sn-glycerol-3-phosphate ABC transporter ATP-binding protein UgpC [Burkholderiaceae bacterium]|nr:sn-glycerol-3-phosphate ABC transporter ATP-binding protein UgpC [Burkholderiaceae bacterium]